MKKRLISFLVLISAFFLIENVQAIEIDKDDIAKGSYVIGTHLFEREQTGTLTVQHIMLAAQTIGSNKLEDMKIYFKTSRGAWVNGLTNESVTMPENIKIEYQNGVDVTVPSPTLETMPGGPYGEYDYIGLNNGEYLYDLAINIFDKQYDNWKLYEKNGSNYTLIEKIDIGVVMPARVEAGNTKTFVATLCKLDNDKEVCSDYSNELVLDTMKNIDKPELGIWVLGVADGKFQFDMGGTPEDISFSHLDGVDYFEKNDAGQYNLINTAKPGYALYKEIDINDVKTYVAKSYALNKSGEKVYSDYSEELVVDPSDYIDKAFGYIEREYPQNNLYNSNTGMYTFYTKINTDYNYFGAWTLYEVEYDENHEIVSKTPILTEYTGVPIRVDIEAGQSKRLMAGLCLNRSDNNYPMTCDYAYTEVAKIDTREFLKTPVLTNYGYSSSEKEKVYYDIDYNYNDYISSSLSGIPSPTVSGISYYKLLEDGSLGFISDSYIATGGPALSFDYGTVTKIFAKAFVIDSKGNRHYSDYSEELVISALDLAAPTVLPAIPGPYEYYLNIYEDGVYGYLENLDLITGVEFYEKHDGQYTLIADATAEDDWGTWVEVNAGENKTIIARVYNEVSEGHRVYSEYSEEFIVSAPALEAPIIATALGALWDVNISETGVYGYAEKLALITGVEFYEIIDGQYNLIADATEEDSWGIVAEVNAGESKIIVAKVYHTDSKGNKVYSEYSNEFSIYSITYDLDGGQINEENPSSYIFDTVNQLVPQSGPLNKPIKDGYTFLGWTGSNGDIPQLEVTIPDGTTGNLHYVANWEKAE